MWTLCLDNNEEVAPDVDEDVPEQNPMIYVLTNDQNSMLSSMSESMHHQTISNVPSEYEGRSDMADLIELMIEFA